MTEQTVPISKNTYRVWDAGANEMKSWQWVWQQPLWRLTSPTPGEQLIWMQCTGHHDLREIPIYEDDIVTFRCDHCVQEHRGLASWIPNLCAFGLWQIDLSFDNAAPFYRVLIDDDAKFQGLDVLVVERVLGNRWENPDLMPDDWEDNQ